MLIQKEYINDTGSSVIITIRSKNKKRAILIIEHEGFDNIDMVQDYKESGTLDYIKKVRKDWIVMLYALKYRQI